ncbi:homoserine dehydrogenase [Oscillochloris sp. ZM17-4]|uniref:homoserine dehydrogenase n=1 Tax=Oscillochloris sp. ZM17-4 TaxID=2866714 RepID=UPI001C73AE90|nr:homoserine dehydrogenase [Oscillochloris sp. ZM17-4]MBX0327730.1 homoserine dehydrogenase [Oscillochloris sp. ZM17-4]
MNDHTYQFVLTGLGNIGRTFLEILISRGDSLRRRYGFDLRCVGVSDSSGVAYDPAGLDIAAIVALKRGGGRVSALPKHRPDLSSAGMVALSGAAFLLEATPTNLQDAQPGLDIVRAALRGGSHAVLASKGPLVLAYAELAAMSDLAGPQGSPALRFSGAVGGALPTINVGRRDLAGATIDRAELIVNGTTQVILEEMAAGMGFDGALAAAQAQGIVEPDPSLDVDGWDAANKLVIFANAVLGQPTGLSDLSVAGIRAVSAEELRAAWDAGGRISVVGLAERQGDGRYRLSVAPATLGPEHPLAHMRHGEMGAVFYSDIIGRTTIASLEDGPMGSTQAMLRDVIEIAGRA